MRHRVRRSLAVVGLAALLALGSLAPMASAATPQTNLPDVEDEVMCTICGTLLAESDSPQADRERALIRRLIDRGETKGQIEDALVAQYGPRVLATPSGHGFDLAAWIVPGLLIALVIIGLSVGATKLVRRSRPPEPQAPLDPGDEARLERDISSYDL
ncbi:MAG TPA: cytochrome c-type biogenesis protein [Solirubrobacterales bacterium]|nr:cytochrome c-type biogenesis protein [Solirubrobacterales bacterium]